jgi:DNA-binding NarL/FixJ family response regulator
VELLQMQGKWSIASAEVERACDQLVGHPAAAVAHYQRGELFRLQGEFAMAEECYRAASRFGRDPQPGLSLLRLAQGRVDAAVASIRRVVEATGDRASRPRVLPAYVDIMLEAGDVTAARRAADELAQAARETTSQFVTALAAHADGAALLAEGNARAACAALTAACAAWRNLDAPYDMARTRVLLALAYRLLADGDTAELEFAAAREAFDALGAVPDRAHVDELTRPASVASAAGLTAREIQVLALVATGRTNREIADDLSISDHTVRRHLQNIFTKTGVSSRAAATAFAFQHDLV